MHTQSTTRLMPYLCVCCPSLTPGLLSRTGPPSSLMLESTSSAARRSLICPASSLARPAVLTACPVSQLWRKLAFHLQKVH